MVCLSVAAALFVFLVVDHFCGNTGRSMDPCCEFSQRPIVQANGTVPASAAAIPMEIDFTEAPRSDIASPTNSVRLLASKTKSNWLTYHLTVRSERPS